IEVTDAPDLVPVEAEDAAAEIFESTVPNCAKGPNGRVSGASSSRKCTRVACQLEAPNSASRLGTQPSDSNSAAALRHRFDLSCEGATASATLGQRETDRAQARRNR